MSNQEYEETLTRIDELTNQIISVMSNSVLCNDWHVSCINKTYSFPLDLKHELDLLIEKRDLFEKDNQIEVIL